MLRRLIALAIGLALMLGITTAFAAQPQTAAANAAVQYIKSLQNSDGGFPAFGSGSTPGATLDAVFALVAQGTNPTTVVTGGNSPDDYLSAQAGSYSSDPGAAAKLALGVAAMGLDITNFGGQNLLSIMNANYNSGTGSYGLDVWDEMFYVFALAKAGQPIPSGVNPYLLSLQQADGGWEFAPGWGSDGNTTSMVMQALRVAGVAPGATAIVNGLSYLDSTQNADGGFGYVAGAESDPNSSALAIQALVATGQNIDEGGPWAPGGNTPMEALLSFRNVSTGAFQYAGEDSPFATYQAVPALMLAPFPDLQPTAVGGIAEAPKVVGAPALTGDSGRRALFALAGTGGAFLLSGGGLALWWIRQQLQPKGG